MGGLYPYRSRANAKARALGPSLTFAYGLAWAYSPMGIFRLLRLSGSSGPIHT